MTYREHPLRIMRYSMKNIWLLIFPLLRGVSVLKFNAAGFYAWIQGAWIDISILALILAYGFMRWYYCSISITDDSLLHTDGVIFHIKRTIPFSKISSVCVEKPLYLVPLRAVYVRCDTRAGIFKSADLKIMVTQKAGEDLISHLPDVEKDSSFRNLQRPGILSVLLFSVFFSSGFSGAVYIAAFFLKGGDIARDLMSLAIGRITEQAEHIYMRLLSGIPKALAMTGLVFIGAWLLSFTVNLMRYSGFRADADKNTINVECGLLNRRHHRIRTEHINYIDIRQNLIMKLCTAAAVNISCPGYGYDSHLPVLLPISREKDLLAMWMGMDADKPTRRQLKYRPKKTSFISYLGYPFLGILLVALADNFIDFLPERFLELKHFLVIMAYIPLTWFLLVKTVALCTSGISVFGENAVIRCSRFTSFHTVIVRLDNILMVQVRQNVIQRFFGTYHLILWLSGESPSRYIVRGLKKQEIFKKL